MSRPKKKLPSADFIKDFLNTDDIRLIPCPLEPDYEDVSCSCEVNYTTGQFYCHNCHRSGTIAELYQLQHDKFLL